MRSGAPSRRSLAGTLVAVMLCGYAVLPAAGPVTFTTPWDTIPNFVQAPTIASARAGAWSDPSTWSPARIPVGTDVVHIAHDVSYDSTTGIADVIGIDTGGRLRFVPNTSTRLRVATLLVMPGGQLEVGTEANPIPASATAEIIFRDRAPDAIDDGIGVYDPKQYGTGLVCVNGTVRMHGAMTSPTFVRLAAEPGAGATSLALASAVSGWAPGDRISLPDSRHLLENEKWSHYQPQWEELTIASVSGQTLQLAGALQFDHPGARDGAGTLEYLPHVARLTRNVVLRSENPAGTRGHSLLTYRSQVDIRFVLFDEMGRTTNEDLGPGNQIGRYPLHLHHLWGPINPASTAPQFRVIGNALTHSLKWPLTVHDSHYGLVQGNVVFDATGAGVVTEDGNETANVFAGNFAMAVVGDVNPRDNDGRDGSVFWFSGFDHHVHDNVAANGINHSQAIVSGSGFNFWWFPGSNASTRQPLYRGADLISGVEGQDFRMVDMKFVPIREFTGNEAYGATATGLVTWALGTTGYDHFPSMRETVIRNFTGWHLHEGGFFGYPNNRVTFDGFIVRGHPRAFGRFEPGVAWSSGDYWAENVTIRRANIQGMKTAICCSTNTVGVFRIEDSYFRTYDAAFGNETLATPGTGAGAPGRRTEIWNSRFEAWPGRPLQTIEMNWRTDRGNSHTTATDQVFVYGYQGNSSNNFRVFYREQASQNIAGGYATCNDVTSRPEIDGITCPVVAPCSAEAPTSLLASVVGNHVSLNWSAPTAGPPPHGYVVEAGSGPGLTDLALLPLGSVPAIAGVAASGRYFVRVRATTTCGTSEASNEIIVDVPSGCGPPGAPGNARFSLADRHVTLSWDPSAGSVVTYRVEVGSSPGLSNLLVTAIGNVTSVAAVAPPGTYHVRIRAVGGCGSISSSSNEVVIVVP
jgi:G8 domain